MRGTNSLRSTGPAALPLHLAECLHEAVGVYPAERLSCSSEAVALCSQAGSCAAAWQRNTSLS